jgi:hypothetical protein
VRRFEVRHPRLGGAMHSRASADPPKLRPWPRVADRGPVGKFPVSVLIGVLVYDEHRRRGPGSGALLLALMILLVIAVIGLGRVETTNEPHPDGEGSL